MKTKTVDSERSRLKSDRGRFIKFILWHIEDVRKKGLRALWRKGRTLFLMVFIAFPLVLLIRLLGPLVLIRVGPLESRRIGHFAANTELYLCARDAGMDNKRAIDIFYHEVIISNWQLKKMWDRMLRVSPLAWHIYMVNRFLPGSKRHMIPIPSDRDIHGLLENTKPHLSFTSEEEQRGVAELHKMGIPDGAQFVCFFARDPTYLDSLHPGNFYYHDYRDANIHNFVPAAEELARRGYFALRMGAVVKEALTTTNPNIIDYANKYRSDFLDIFLGAKCRFFIGDTAGIHAISKIFRRPIAYANFIPLEYVPTWSPHELFIPKKIWLPREHRFLTFREILDSGIGRFVLSEQYEKLGIEIIENTPEEITALVVEMDERMEGRWQTTEEDEELQRRFWSLFKKSEINILFKSRIGAEFLRQNVKLLE